MKFFVSIFLVGLLGQVVAESSSKICLPDCSKGSCIFDVNVVLTAGQLGYFNVKGCDGVNPTLGVEIGVTHTFLQTQYENYYHPLGLAYFPDGAHNDTAELEPGIPPPDSGSDCASTMSCPAPMYFLNGAYLGTYSNDPDVLPVTSGETNFGLDDYEPIFYYPFDQWLGFGKFSLNLRFDQFYDKDIFYFCHIHQFMTGRIKLLQNGVPTQPDANLPEIPYAYDQPTEYDKSCGSYGITDFQLPNPQCPERFVCDAGGGSMGKFADCIESQNCYMFIGMTTGVSARSEIALFLHMMIPHHENAINMAKTLLQNGNLNCDEFTYSTGCIMYQIGLEIVDSQNFQVQQMRGLLESYGYNQTDDCVVPVSEREGGGMAHYEHRRMNSGAGPDWDADLNFLESNNVEGNSFVDADRVERDLSDGSDNICISSTGTYTIIVDLYAGELGYYTFEECGDMVNPTIGIEIGETYVFDQSDRTNYYHPIGFAYYPDGNHANLAELEPGIQPYGSSSDCASDKTCPAPMYVMDDTYLGVYSNIPDVVPATKGESNFGLDEYEPLFYRPMPEWANSSFSVLLKFDVEDFQNDIFYFCHIHQFMAGRIKLLKNGVPITEEDVPKLPYTYDVPGKFDEKCGTYGLDQFQLPNPECFEPFVCNVPSGDSNLELFSECIEAMNCAMLSGMTTKSTSNSEMALFNHHMIPHHQNAVNMAKSTLKFGKFQCDDLTSSSDDCVLEQILREIINNQNFQIQLMFKVLSMLGLPAYDDCIVTFTGDGDGSESTGDGEIMPSQGHGDDEETDSDGHEGDSDHDGDDSSYEGDKGPASEVKPCKKKKRRTMPKKCPEGKFHGIELALSHARRLDAQRQRQLERQYI